MFLVEIQREKEITQGRADKKRVSAVVLLLGWDASHCLDPDAYRPKEEGDVLGERHSKRSKFR